MYMQMSIKTRKRVLDLLQLKVEMVVRHLVGVLRIKLMSFSRTEYICANLLSAAVINSMTKTKLGRKDLFVFYSNYWLQ